MKIGGIRVLFIIIMAILRVQGQSVLTRILPPDQLILPPSPLRSSPPSNPHGRAMVWCLVTDLDPDTEQVQSLELFFKSAPQVRTAPDADRELFEGSFSQFGFPAREDPKEREKVGEEGLETIRRKGSESVEDRERDVGLVTKSEGFPEAQFTGLTKNQRQTNSANVNTPKKIGSRDVLKRGSSLDKRGLLPGSVPVARVTASASAKLGVQHVQRSGVMVRGVISSSNPNLSSLQVSLQRAKCRDCGTYLCVLRYHDSLLGNVTETRSSRNLIVAQSVTRRLNVRIQKESLPSNIGTTTNNNSKGSSKNNNNNDNKFSSTSINSQSATTTTNNNNNNDIGLFCFGTISSPNTPIVWERQSIDVSTNSTHVDIPDLIQQGEPRLGQYCQHWRASLLHHSLAGTGQLWRFHCFLSRDRDLRASVLLSKSGLVVTATCGDPNSTSLTQDGDNVSIICDVTAPIDVSTSVMWHRRGRQVGSCEVISNMTRWECSTSEPAYAVTSDGTRFVLSITQYDVIRDKGLWECLVTPLWSETASACVLG